MASVKISDLTSLVEGDIVTSTDVVPIVDDSAGETKKSTSQAVVNAGLKAPGPIGGTTPNAVTATTVLSNSGKIGYTTGAGGYVSQGSWLADVTLNKVCGQIEVYDSTGDLTPLASYAFMVHNNTVSEGDVVILTLTTGSNSKILYQVLAAISGGFIVSIVCLSAAPVNGVVLSFAVIKNTTT